MEIQLILAFLVVVVLVTLVYGVTIRNDLARRWERLLGLAANVKAARQRRQGVGHDVARHLVHAQRHEQRIQRSGSQRGRRGGGKFINVADNANGWPGVSTTDVTSQGMGLDVSARGTETAARETLHAEAQQYNAIVKSWPSCIVAQACGYRTWRFRQPDGRRRR
jgi:hypothetical protein